jgi:hypothetical protein
LVEVRRCKKSRVKLVLADPSCHQTSCKRNLPYPSAAWWIRYVRSKKRTAPVVVPILPWTSASWLWIRSLLPKKRTALIPSPVVVPRRVRLVATGEEGDKSNLCQFKWYDWCYVRDQKQKSPSTARYSDESSALRKEKVTKWLSGY